VEWLGVDGSTWDLRNGEVRLALSSTGWGLAELTTFVQSNGVRDGQRATGWRAEPRTLQWPMKKGYGTWSSRQFLEVDRAWWAACLPHKSGTVRVTGPDGLQRTLRARVTADGPYTMEYDPSDVLVEDFSLALTADDPWWKGPQTFTPYGVSAVATPFYGPSGYGPPFYISAGNSSGSQPISNPGDVDAWPVWTLTGPLSTFTITHPDGGQVAGAPNLLAGEQLVIDTRPGAKFATRTAADGTTSDYTPSLTSWDWRPIPAGTTQNIAVALTGTGGAVAAIEPRYFRAW
jgi:hypothetical protein